ncbi:MAG: hypothetical protein NTU47_05905 [Ignavibacteriales bacterium]|nr:hypothetical protein [Ignavibacteriales bacterium]
MSVDVFVVSGCQLAGTCAAAVRSTAVGILFLVIIDAEDFSRGVEVLQTAGNFEVVFFLEVF